MAIEFYRSSGPFFCLTNFAEDNEYQRDGHLFSTTEHDFQAHKTLILEEFVDIRDQLSPAAAAEAGRSRDISLRGDWDSIRDDVMYRANCTKYMTHQNVRHTLLQTGNEILIEKSPKDPYWGSGIDGTGKNMQGRTLMHIRHNLRASKRVVDLIDQKREQLLRNGEAKTDEDLLECPPLIAISTKPSIILINALSPTDYDELSAVTFQYGSDPEFGKIKISNLLEWSAFPRQDILREHKEGIPLRHLMDNETIQTIA